MKHYYCFYTIFSLIFFFHNMLLGVDIGSDATVQIFNTQQTLNSGDRIANLAVIAGGFALADNNTQATFDSKFPVTGDIELNGGTLVLGEEMILHNISSVPTWGNVVGNNYVIELSQAIQTVPNLGSGSSAVTANNLCNVSRIVQQQFTGVTVNSVHWSFDNRFLALGMSGPVAALGNNNLLIYELVGTSLVFRSGIQLSSTSITNINSVRWHPTLHRLAVGRTVTLLAQNPIFILDFNPITFALTITDQTGGGLVALFDATAVAWHPSGNFLAVGTGVLTLIGSQIRIYSVSGGGLLTLVVTESIGLLQLISIQSKALDWDVTGNFLAAGFDGVVGILGIRPQVRVYTFTQGPPALTLNASQLIGPAATISIAAAVSAVDWNPGFPTRLAIGITLGLFTPPEPIVQLFNHNSGAGTLTQLTTITNLNQSVHAIDWAPTGSCLAVGRDVLSGAGWLRLYSYNNTTPQFSVSRTFSLTNHVRAVNWSPSGRLIVIGDNAGFASVYQNTFDFLTSNTTFSSNNVHLRLNNDLTLPLTSLRFTGESSIDGQGHTLTLAENSCINVDSGGKLLLQNITIRGITNNRCLALADNTASFTFENTQLILDGNYTFSVGSFVVLNELVIAGEDKVFTYQTDQISTVSSYSILLLDNGITFSYDPTINSPDRLQFIDKTSVLELDGQSRLHAVQDIALTKGTLRPLENSFLSSEIQESSDEGIILGDDTNATNDCRLEITGSSRLSVSQGYLTYKNVSTASSVFTSYLSQIRMLPDTTLRLFRNLPVSEGAVVFENNTILARKAGVNILGSTIIQGSLTLQVIP